MNYFLFILFSILLLAPYGLLGGCMTTPEYSDPYLLARQQMVKIQAEARGIDDPNVLNAMRIVPRHLFVPQEYQERSYEDSPLPIGHQQTISQPYMVGFMSQAIKPKSTDRILEIGTGCGYQAAILSRICQDVFTIEIVEPLSIRTKETLAKLGYNNVHTRISDGYRGWPEEAPFDAIIVTAACPSIPEPLIEQLKLGGTIIIPVGQPGREQILIKGTKTQQGLQTEQLFPVRFVPLTGEGQDKRH